MSELSGTPAASWTDPLLEAEEERLLKIQDLSSFFGEYARGRAWGSYLGARRVERLGGYEKVEEEAPVASVNPLPGGGAYLQLTPEPVTLASEEFRARGVELERFLTPVMPPGWQ